MQTSRRGPVGRSPVPVESPWAFFAAAYALTWTWWFAAIALGVRFDSAAGAALVLLGLVGPGVVGSRSAVVSESER